MNSVNENKKNKKSANATSVARARTPRGRGEVRIAAGRWRQTPLRVADVEGLRPTSDRIRGTVFDWLNFLLGGLEGRDVCDLFAGSGALGLEAVSRGAATLDAVEFDAGNARAIAAVVEKLGAKEYCRVHRADAFAFARAASPLYDVVFIDPPFAKDWQEKAVRAMLHRLKPGGILYVESPEKGLSDELITALGLTRLRSSKAGAVAFELLTKDQNL